MGNSLITRANPLKSSSSVDVLDDIIFKLGTGGDQALLNRSTILAADAELTSVIVGTSEHPALAANSLIISNTTADGDILIAVNDGGNSIGVLHFVGGVGIAKFYGELQAGADIKLIGTTPTIYWGQATGYIQARDINGSSVIIQARDTDAGLVEVARFQGAVDPYFSMGGSQEFKFYESGRAELKGIVSTGAEADLTIATGVVVVTQTYHSIITQGGADDILGRANGGSNGDILILKSNLSGTDGIVTVQNGTGANAFILAGGADFLLDHIDDRIMLIHNGTEWVELSRSSNS